MKIPLSLKCEGCSSRTLCFVGLYQDDHQNICGNCKQSRKYELSDISLSDRLLYFRSAYEYQHSEDYNLSIVFSAMAFECELFRVYKFKECKPTLKQKLLCYEKDFEKAFKDMGTVIKKIDKISRLYTLKSFDDFVCSSPDFKNTAMTGFPSLGTESLKDSFHAQLFKPRNAILHSGKEFDKEVARRAFHVSGFGLNILEAMTKSIKPKSYVAAEGAQI